MLLLAGCGSSPPAPIDASSDALAEAADAPNNSPPIDAGILAKRVFVSSLTFDGASLKSTTDADKACEAMATAAKLGGYWQAWISDGVSSSPATRFGPPFNGPYVLAFQPKTEIAPNAAGFAKKLEHAIDVDENGVMRGGFAWTQTDPNGDFLPTGVVTGSACEAWSSASPDKSGSTGSVTATGSEWTFVGTQSCDTMGRIYCFEQ